MALWIQSATTAKQQRHPMVSNGTLSPERKQATLHVLEVRTPIASLPGELQESMRKPYENDNLKFLSKAPKTIENSHIFSIWHIDAPRHVDNHRAHLDVP